MAELYDAETSRKALAAVASLIDSGVLGEGSRLRPLLRYLIDEELAGRGGRLKAYSIGTDVFGRSEDFDPNSDSIVRVEVHRLRQALDHYYATQGADDPIRIEIPRGTYRPTITATAEGAAAPAAAALRRRTRFAWAGAGALLALLLAAGAWMLLQRAGPSTEAEESAPLMALEVLPFDAAFDAASGGTAVDRLAESLTDALIAGLTKVKALTVVVRDPRFGLRTPAASAENTADSQIGVGYVVRGSVQSFAGDTRVVVHLIEARSGALLWAQSYRREGNDVLSLQDQLVATIVAELRAQMFSAAKLSLAEQDPDTLSAWELYIQATWQPGAASSSLAWERERIALAERALELRPDFGQAHAVLAEKLPTSPTSIPRPIRRRPGGERSCTPSGLWSWRPTTPRCCSTSPFFTGTSVAFGSRRIPPAGPWSWIPVTPWRGCWSRPSPSPARRRRGTSCSRRWPSTTPCRRTTRSAGRPWNGSPPST
jgi:TolB-like protein